jgi:lauroyl/myristoyl acyltransferase
VVEFFGRPTLLPDGHVRLALHTGAALICAQTRREEGEYWLRLCPLEVTRSGDDEVDVQENAQRLAAVLEQFIRSHPEQWHLFQRLWE